MSNPSPYVCPVEPTVASPVGAGRAGRVTVYGSARVAACQVGQGRGQLVSGRRGRGGMHFATEAGPPGGHVNRPAR